MASKRFEEFLKNAPPELKAKIAEAGKESLDKGTDVPKASEYSDQSPNRHGGGERRYAAPPEPSYNPSNQQSDRRIDRAMTDKAQAKEVQPGKEPQQEKAAPAKEPER